MPRAIKNVNLEIGLRIKERRRAMKLTRECLARQVGYSANFIQEVERGRSGLSSESIRAFAMALQVSTDTLLFGESSEELEFILNRLKAVPPDKLPHVIDLINAAVECAK